MITRFADHSSTNRLLPVQQSVYRPYRSTETAIVSVFNDVVRTVDNGNVSLLVLLGLSAAFDTVDSIGPTLVRASRSVLHRLHGFQLVQVLSVRSHPDLCLRRRSVVQLLSRMQRSSRLGSGP